MHHRLRLPFLLVMTGLAGCATQAPPPPQQPAAPQQPMVAPSPMPQQPMAPPRQPPAVPPQSLAAGPFFTQTGLASFYGRAHAGKRTASGEKFDHLDFTAAHRTLAFGTLVRVTNLSNGRTVTVEISDRGPRIESRIVDLSLAAASALGMKQKGIARVKLEAFRADQAGPG
jgi:rare lipoprotein A